MTIVGWNKDSRYPPKVISKYSALVPSDVELSDLGLLFLRNE